MKTEKKKFFFSSDEKINNACTVLEKTQMKKVSGGTMEMRDPTPGRTYTESTYVKH
ncbi:hypothetical protein [Flavobacterium pectinovorum]|uniref:Uncharacterized protein n=1 Tax=Flavobacterium pectinovorum TaxID=29533 RepID=A0ABY1J161_9FLAO|nr:hypothetical protein [Flavobacterium pectinovorum]SHL94400.1 hypothetical protein SAMN05444387_1505 [Flavobacterium pectinovorum]